MDYSSVNNFHSFAFTLIAANPQSELYLIVLLIVLLLLSFTTSGAEVALFSLPSKDVNMLRTKQHTAARRITGLLDERKAVYTSLLIASAFFNISIIILSDYLLSPLLHFGTINFIIPVNLDWLVKVIAIAFVLVLVCKILPKVWASQNNLRFAYSTSSVVEALHLLLRQVSLYFVRIADRISSQSGADAQASNLKELDEAIDVDDKETTIEERNILKGIVKFGNISVKQIMRVRVDVNGLNYNLSFGEVLRKAEELHYSRLPVYKTNLDEISGVLNTKDLLPHIHNKELDWHSLIRTPLFVPETKLIRDLLKEFQTKRIHFAIVVDEFGGTSGIVTMEDILEEIIGDIRDEFDEEDTSIRKVDDKTYIVDAKVMIHDMCRAMNLPIDTFDVVRGESDSLGGLVLEISGKFPEIKEVIKAGDFDFVVLEIEKNRITTVKVTINKKDEE
ncbi:MAG: gliding motility-associated protein GldE [Chitinophagaceae bacterium]|nr:gliding motility-associated protein GldE [Chitinophagaceae bacterium]